MQLEIPPHKKQNLCCSTLASNLKTDGTDEYVLPVGAGAPSVTEAARTLIMGVAGKFVGMRIELNNAPGAGKSRTFTLRVSSVSQTLTVTISDTATTGSDFAHVVSIAAAEDLCILSDGGVGTPAATTMKAVLVFEPNL